MESNSKQYGKFDLYEPCVPHDDDDGSSRLDCFLRDYRRINRAYACRQSATKIPAVWVHTNNFWAPLASDVVGSMLKKASPEGSICGALKANLFKLKKPLRDVTEHAFADEGSPQIVGLYENKLDKSQSAIVVDLKKQQIPWDWILPSFLGGVMGGIAGAHVLLR